MGRPILMALLVPVLLGASSGPAITRSQVRSAADHTAALSREEQNNLVNDFCSGCHSAKTRKGDLVLEGFDAASPFLGTDVLEKMILKVRTGMMPPASSDRPEPRVLAAFVETLEARADAASARAADPGFRPFQRLNRAEYQRAVRDLLAVDIDPATFLPQDTVSAGFDNIADVQTVSPALITAYLRGAAQVSRLAVGSKVETTESRRRVFSCRPKAKAEETTCASSILQRLEDTAYRGTGTAEDHRAALSFYEQGSEVGGFEQGIRMALQSILASPRFLLRTESATTPGAREAVNDMALASRLSFFLWSSGPDETLKRAVRRGSLRASEGLSTQVSRMLADPKADALPKRFAAQWLRLQDLGKTPPDRALFPKADEALIDDMRRETELFLKDLFRQDRSVLELITADRTFVNERLAAHYGIPGVTGAKFREVRLPPERRGLLGQGSVLTLTSLSDRTSPVLRGKWVLDVLLGTPPPPPPPNVPALDDTVKTVRDGKPLSTRQRVEEHRRNPACASCHKAIDPPGLALEGFDAIGAARQTDNKVPIDSTADLYDGRRIAGPSGLRDALIAHQDQVLRNFASQLLTYATGRRLGPRDMPAVRAVVKSASARGNRFSAFVNAIVASEVFRTTRPAKES